MALRRPGWRDRVEKWSGELLDIFSYVFSGVRTIYQKLVKTKVDRFVEAVKDRVEEMEEGEKGDAVPPEMPPPPPSGMGMPSGPPEMPPAPVGGMPMSPPM